MKEQNKTNLINVLDQKNLHVSDHKIGLISSSCLGEAHFFKK